uniref:Nucleoside diphosphate kinase n=1 Tax=Serinus canaria TaxID=9135 RepID=A0A8C9N313_SERCA
MWAYILAHENAVPLWRSLMGPTKVFRARYSDPDSIRGAYGLTDTRNTTHGSDSPASASREIAFFFPEFDEQRWYEQDEPRLRRGQLLYSCGAGTGHLTGTCEFGPKLDLLLEEMSRFVSALEGTAQFGLGRREGKASEGNQC